MPSLGSGLSLGTLNSLPGYDFDVSAFIQQTGVSPTATIKDFTGVTAPSMTNVRLQGTATGLTLSATEDFTLAGWFNNTTPITGANFLFGFGNSFKLYMIPSGANTFLQFEYGSTNVGPHTFTIPSGTWFHVALTSFRSGGGSQSHKLYVNGSLVSTHTTSVAQTLSSPTFYIGGGGSSEYALGLIADEVSFFKRELSSLEISFLYASGDGLSYSEASSAISMNNIYSWYSLSETTGNRLNSVNSSVCPLSSNGSGTIVNARGWVAPKITINPRKQLNDFVLGIKGLGLWGNTICWPLRSYQNIGTGAIVYSLGGYGAGTSNLTLISNPSKNESGILTNGSGQYATGTIPESSQWTILAIMARPVSEDVTPKYYWGLHNSANSNVNSLNGVTYYLKDGGLGIFQSENGVNNWSGPGGNRPGANATPNFGFQSVSYSETGPTATISLNGTFVTQTSVRNLSALRQNRLILGRRSDGTNATDSVAVHTAYLYINTNLSNSTIESIRTLYKTTIGTGLGLI